MKNQSYPEQIKNPKWQRKRLEVFNRDNFTCQRCGSSKKEIQVHHLVYHPGNKIWEYKDHELITLCKDCHKHESENLNPACKMLIYNIRTSGMLSDEIYELAQYHKGKGISHG